MKSTADRYREAGMPAPKGEVYIPNSRVARARSEALLREAARHAGGSVEVAVPTVPLLVERVHDPATDPATLPDLPATAYGPDSVPLDTTPDADTTEEQS
ncbi:hypothetical protein [Cellulomonas sp. ES6]|uniref:hypothetical protein n=1 Tax=Cellulomonas sp. ES6 TaxID=3039384 RepID=UPI0024B6B602|nr:hypothetical protein [Cellulomonas sp. ES6]WHP18837.1 hypothetical protein P9841_06890 [Cellulomonas sp. ES6]